MHGWALGDRQNLASPTLQLSPLIPFLKNLCLPGARLGFGRATKLGKPNPATAPLSSLSQKIFAYPVHGWALGEQQNLASPTLQLSPVIPFLKNLCLPGARLGFGRATKLGKPNPATLPCHPFPEKSLPTLCTVGLWASD